MESPSVLHVCTSVKKGTPKRAVPSIELRVDHGVTGDAHGGNWHRQVSLLDNAEIDTMRARGLDLKPGAFGENMVVRGLDLGALGLGSRLTIGPAELELTQIGKVCHHRCAIYHRTGDCIMPRAGVFARVLRGGEVRPETPVRVSRHVGADTIQAAVITVSDRCAAGTAVDTAGPAVARIVERHLDGHIAAREIVPDERNALEKLLRDYADRSYDLIITVGGTGFGPRDVTPEATKAVIEREAPGLAEVMRAASLRVTPHAMLQRGLCGMRRRTLIVNLPGSEIAAVDNLTAVLTALPHAVNLLRGHTEHA